MLSYWSPIESRIEVLDGANVHRPCGGYPTWVFRIHIESDWPIDGKWAQLQQGRRCERNHRLLGIPARSLNDALRAPALLPDRSTEQEWRVPAKAAIRVRFMVRLNLGRLPPVRGDGKCRRNTGRSPPLAVTSEPVIGSSVENQ